MDELTRLLPPAPPPRELPNHAAHRAGLLTAVAAEPAVRDALWPPRGRLAGHRWLVAGAAAAAVVAIALAITVLRPGTTQPPAPGIGQHRPVPAAPAGSLTATRHWQVPASGLSRLVIDSQAGSVIVSAGQPGRAQLAAVPSYRGEPPIVTSSVRGSVLTVTVRCPAANQTHCQVALTTEVPRQLPVIITAELGDVTIARLAGAVHVTDELGNVQLQNVTGSISVDAELGNIGGSGLGPGSVSLTAQLGTASLAFAAPPALISATADEGSLTIRVPAITTYQVRASADLGSITVRVPRSPGATHRIQARSQLGSVTVTSS